MTKWLIVIVAEKKETCLCENTIEERTKEIMKEEFSDNKRKFNIKEIIVKEVRI